jgi:hypothetical protein
MAHRPDLSTHSEGRGDYFVGCLWRFRQLVFRNTVDEIGNMATMGI